MTVDVMLPEISEEIKKVRVLFWFKNEGEKVTKGEELVEVTTEKAVIDVESPATGTLASILVGPDEDAAVGEKIGAIEAE